MGIRGELYSTKVSLENRTYFFNVKENRVGDLYLNIVESKNKDAGGFDRQSVVLFADDLQEFLKGFDDSLRVMEKAVREKNKPSKSEVRHRDREDREDRDHGKSAGDRGDKNFGRGKSSGDDRPRKRHDDRPFTPRGDKPFTRGEGGFKGRDDKPFDRGDRPFAPRGDKPFAPRGDDGFKGRGSKSFDRTDRPFGTREEGGFKGRADKPFGRDDRPFKAREEGAFGARKKFVKANKPTAGSHGIKGPLHKGRIVKAVRRRDVPED